MYGKRCCRFKWSLNTQASVSYRNTRLRLRAPHNRKHVGRGRVRTASYADLVQVGRDEAGVWSITPTADEQDRQPDFLAQFPRYLNAFDSLFEKAQEANEFEFLMTMLGFRGMQAPGWNAYETTLQATSSLTRVHNELPPTDAVAARHLKLWLYGHIVEASEPYEVTANLLAIATGGRFRIARFPVGERGQMPSPGQKIESLAADTTEAGFAEIAEPLREIWDRQFRNAIFHADYALHGAEVRLISSQRSLSGDEVEALCARANAYHDALALLRRSHLQSYTEPVTIPAQPFAPPPEKATVIVRGGEGAVGLKDALTAAERDSGAIPFRLVVQATTR